MAIELKVTIAKMDGTVLRTVVVNGDYLKAGAVYPEDMLGQCIVEALAENFDTQEK